MTALFRKIQWWLGRGTREAELREELQFHLDEEQETRQADGLSADDATWAARRDLGIRCCWLKMRARCGRGRCSSSWPRTFATACAAWRRTACSPSLRHCRWRWGSGRTRQSTASWTRFCCDRCRSRSRIAGRAEVAEQATTLVRRRRARSSCTPWTAAPSTRARAPPARSSRSPHSSVCRRRRRHVLSSLFAHKRAGA